MKKKPPPGATLIARLKERRLQREQEGTDEVVDALSTQPVADDHQAQNSVETVDVHVVQPEAEPAAPVERKNQIAERGRRRAVDFLHAAITITDLRPQSSNLSDLTDEIRLAGRFAAVGLIAQGLRLAKINYEEIYKTNYSSFEEYCRDEHHMSATYAYRLIRMAQMAEQLSSVSHSFVRQSLPDPFEVMLSLGHRHLIALLPLAPDAAAELLARGLPESTETVASTGDAESSSRIPLSKATEKQIRVALQSLMPEDRATSSRKQAAYEAQLLLPLARSITGLEKAIDWAEANAKELKRARIEKGDILRELAQKVSTLADALAELSEE